MKRTLLEIASGLAVLVLIASLQQQIVRLRADSREVHQLKTLVQTSIETRGTGSDPAQQIEQLERKIRDLEVRVQEASQNGANTANLEEALQRQLAETSKLRNDITRDVNRTQTLLDTYVDELRSSTRRAQTSLEVTRSELAHVRERVEPDHRSLTRNMIAPTVQLNGDDTVGSGTLVFSGKHPKTGQVESYVLTAHHVVRNILADTPSARTQGVLVTIYLANGSRRDVRAEVTLSEPRFDTALLKLKSEELFPNLARVLPRSRAGEVEVWHPIVAVGCPLGNDPVPSSGTVSSLKNELNGSNYWMINAPTYFGNSGGGIYLADSCELVGVFSKIYTHGKSTPVVVPHMGLCTPISTVHEWLEGAKLGWVLEGTGEQTAAAEFAAPPK